MLSFSSIVSNVAGFGRSEDRIFISNLSRRTLFL